MNLLRTIQATATIVVTSPTLQDGQPIPREHTFDGANTSPALAWRNVPPGTKELVVALVDQDEVSQIASRNPMLHWVVCKIPPTVTGLPAAVSPQQGIEVPQELQGSFQAYTVFDTPGYRGPQPPPGTLHHYRFIVYTLDTPLTLTREAGANDVIKATRGHVIGEGALSVTYERKAQP